MPSPYSIVRLKWSRAVLADMLRRWGIYVIVGVFVLCSAAANSIVAAMGLLAWSVLQVLRLWRGALALIPFAIGQASLLMSLLLLAGPFRTNVLAIYVLAGWGAHVAQVVWGATPTAPGSAPKSPSARVSAWLLSLAVMVSLASEVMK